MVEQFATPPINPIVSIRPLTTASPGRDALAANNPLANLPPGTTIQGFVVNRDAMSNPILRTPLGDLQMQSDVFVKTGSQMVIRVDANAESRARIITIDGLPPQDYAAQNARGLTQDTITQSAMLQRPAAPALPGTSLPAAAAAPLQGMLLSATPPAATNPLFAGLPATAAMIPAGLLKLQAGAALKVTLLQLELPTQITTQPAQPPVPAQTGSPIPAASPAPPPSTTGMPSPAPLQTNAPAPTAPAAPMAPATGNLAPIDAIAGKQSSSITSAAAPVTTANTAAAAMATTAPATASVVTGHTVSVAPPAELLGNAVAAQTNRPLAAERPAYAPTPPATTTGSSQPITSNAQRLPANAELNAARTVPALVIGHEADGGHVVQTPVGVLKIYSGIPLPLHSKLTLQITPDTPATAKPASPEMAAWIPEASTDRALSSLSRDWPGLTQTLQQLGQTDPALARDLMQLLPQPGPKLASSLLFFMAAVKGGDMRQWMGGRLASGLELKLPEAATRIKNDMAQLQQLFLHSPIDQWTGMMLPMLNGQQLDYARMYLREELDDGSGGEGKAREQRFIVEVELSHLGEMQFDGFVRQTSPKKQFDLIIRTARPLDASISTEIRALFETAIATTGYNGYLGFQQGAQHLVRPLAGAATPGNRSQDGHTILA